EVRVVALHDHAHATAGDLALQLVARAALGDEVLDLRSGPHDGHRTEVAGDVAQREARRLARQPLYRMQHGLPLRSKRSGQASIETRMRAGRREAGIVRLRPRPTLVRDRIKHHGDTSGWAWHAISRANSDLPTPRSRVSSVRVTHARLLLL